MEPDPLLRRLGRNALVVCAAMMAAAFVLRGWTAAAAVAAGGLVMGIGVYALHGGSNALAALLTGAVPRAERHRVARRAAVKVVGRYALLAFLAYVMIARLRLHPLGLLAGASSIAAAAVIEAARLLLNGSKRST